MEQHKIIPFYKAYHMTAYQMPAYQMPVYGLPPYGAPGYMSAYPMSDGMPVYMAQDTDIEEDLQYLQEIFPEASRRYAAKIASVVDRLDYKGSMIYDEYPDRLRLQRLSEEILRMIEKEEAKEREKAAAGGGTDRVSPDAGGAMKPADPEAEAEGVGTGRADTINPPMDSAAKAELIYVLLCYEIMKRRHGGGKDLSRFYGKNE